MIYVIRSERNDWNNHPEWLALRELLKHPEWERYWVMQEVVLTSKIFVVYGGKYIDWNVLLAVINAFTPEEAGPIRKRLANEDCRHTTTTPSHESLGSGAHPRSLGSGDWRAPG